MGQDRAAVQPHRRAERLSLYVMAGLDPAI
jgi:hypothetical protein